MTERPRGGGLFVLLAAAALAACAPAAVVVVGASYDPARVKSVALSSFSDFPGATGSGDVAANTFEKYLLANYRLVDASAADALAIGALTDYTGARDETVMVDVPREQSDPVYGQVVTTQRSGDARVRTTQNVVTGYVLTQTSELLWSVSASASGDDLAAAAEAASSAAMQAVTKRLKAR